jgi:hypothetical protein
MNEQTLTVNPFHMEGELKGCKGAACEVGCCDDGAASMWLDELRLFPEKVQQQIQDLGVELEQVNDRLLLTNCSVNKECVFTLIGSKKDHRPMDCKIYPYSIDRSGLDALNNQVHLYFWDNLCPVVIDNQVDEGFKQGVINIVEHDFLALYGRKFTAILHDEVSSLDTEMAATKALLHHQQQEKQWLANFVPGSQVGDIEITVIDYQE